MSNATVRTALTVARSAERFSCWHSSDWPDLAVQLLLAGADDAEIAELAGLPSDATGWDTDPLVACLYEKHHVPVPDVGDAVALIARLAATDLHTRPAGVTAPMIRLLAPLALRAPESDLAQRCYRGAEYLDCDCAAIGPQLAREIGSEIEYLTPLELPGRLVHVLADPLRSTLPVVQPARGH